MGTPSSPPVEEATFEAVAATLTAQEWTFAKSMPQWPHEYALKRAWRGPVPFDQVIAFIRAHGYWAKWHGRRFRQFDVGEHYYWLMAPPYILINRKPLSQKDVE